MNTLQATFICTRCDGEKARHEFPNYGDGRRKTYCRDCVGKDYRHGYYTFSGKEKRCCHCGEIKLLTQYPGKSHYCKNCHAMGMVGRPGRPLKSGGGWASDDRGAQPMGIAIGEDRWQR